MNETADNSGAPRKVLLATDLSARGDRALERAVLIARRYDLQLIILHVHEEIGEPALPPGSPGVPSWRRPPDAATIVKRRIQEGLRADLGDAVDKAVILIEQGHPAEVIEQVASSELVDLVITGVARESPLSRHPVVLGRTVEQLLRRLPVPMLIVRNRARDAYRHVVVATDFSQPSAHALQTAVRFFPVQPLYLLHACDPPASALVDDPALHAEICREVSASALRDFLASVFLPEPDRRRLVPLIEPGSAQQIVREYVQMHAGDLVVMGTQGRRPVMEAILGSTAKSILETLPCDALVVRGPRR